MFSEKKNGPIKNSAQLHTIKKKFKRIQTILTGTLSMQHNFFSPLAQKYNCVIAIILSLASLARELSVELFVSN